jgi:hypothetical protein
MPSKSFRKNIPHTKIHGEEIKNSALNIIDGVSRTSCMSTGTCNIMKIMGKEWHYASALLHSI